MGFKGEVPEVEEKEQKKILKIIKRRGVEWKDEFIPPVALDIRHNSKGSGVLEALSLALTGSYLHLPLLKANNFNDKQSIQAKQTSKYFYFLASNGD
ncbi:unnamed protein product [Darwinula stevensoni]|uniref:Uncharacterized protein n=1 Tax=Darwinula stevensoni TaxID=69355 RepID=A0A7R8XCM3_9CRUS|nr:unnamed protein product [Darwinula stevensoni]CAG0887865.1 unnamed protein product [Darwinula stevensoni]